MSSPRTLIAGLASALGVALSLAGCYSRPPPPHLPPLPLPGDAAPAGASSPGEPLACEVAVTQVLAKHPALRAARAGLPVSRARLEAAGRLSDPELRLREDAQDLGGDMRLGVRWQPPRPGVGAAEEATAGAGIELTQAEIRLLEVRLAAAVRMDYAAARHAEVERVERERDVEIAEARAALLAARVEAGRATAVGGQLAVIEVRTAAHTAARARDDAAEALRAVTRWTGQPPALGPCDPPPQREDAAAVDAHPAVIGALASLAAARATAFAKDRAGWLWPSFFEVTWARDRRAREENRLMVEAGIDLPFFSGERGDVAGAEVAVQRRRLTATRLRVHQELLEARARFATARGALVELQADADAMAAAEAMAEHAEAVGARPEDVIELRLRLSRWRRGVNDARRTLAVREAQLRLRLGLP